MKSNTSSPQKEIEIKKKMGLSHTSLVGACFSLWAVLELLGNANAVLAQILSPSRETSLLIGSYGGSV